MRQAAPTYGVFFPRAIPAETLRKIDAAQAIRTVLRRHRAAAPEEAQPTTPTNDTTARAGSP